MRSFFKAPVAPAGSGGSAVNVVAPVAKEAMPKPAAEAQPEAKGKGKARGRPARAKAGAKKEGAQGSIEDPKIGRAHV